MSNAIQHEYASYGYATDGSLALRPKSHTFVVIPGLASDPVDDWSEKGKDICGESEHERALSEGSSKRSVWEYLYK